VKQIQTPVIILSRTDFGEADRILTVITPEQGKLRLMARGVRRVKSKLAGGIELFSVSNVTYIPGRGEISTLVSARLDTHYGKIVQDIDRTMLGYELIKLLAKNTEDEPETDYFTLLHLGFAALNELSIPVDIIRLWFQAQLVRLAGHSPNLQSDAAGERLQIDQTYNFDIDAMTFVAAEDGRFSANHIKVLRLLFSGSQPQVVAQVQSISTMLNELLPLLRTISQTQLRS